VGQERSTNSAGISSLGLLLGLAGLLAVLVIVALVVSVTLPDNHPSSTSTTFSGSQSQTTTAGTGSSGTPGASAVAACESDLRSVQVALAAYQATTGANAAPPAQWSAATYPTNFSPLTDASRPGPYLKMPPSDDHYVVEFDSAGQVWVEPGGTFTASYDAANDASSATVCSRVAH
jgi:hypothetical protein